MYLGYKFPTDTVPLTHGELSELQLMAATSMELQHSNPQHLTSPSDQLLRIQKLQQGSTRTLTRRIEVLNVDHYYRFPLKQLVKAEYV